MTYSIKSLLLISGMIVFLATLSYCSKSPQQDLKMISKIYDTQSIASLFNVTPEEIKSNTSLYIEEAQKVIDSIIAVPDKKRSYTNTAKPYDNVCALSNLAIAQNIYSGLELVSPDESLRNAAHEAYIAIESFWVDQVSSNKKLYDAFLSYSAKNDDSENLSPQQRYFIQEVIVGFQRRGLSLANEILAQVNVLRKELTQLCSDFERNIAQDNRFITVRHEDLKGLDDDFIASLKTTDDGLYILGVDYPTYFKVLENCSVEETRKQLYFAFNNRAYPVNEEILKTIIEKRHELANLLGYSDFAHCNIDGQMAHTPERAQRFIDDLSQKSLKKAVQEVELFKQNLPAGVTLINGKLKAWDAAYIKNEYKKNHFNLDEEKVAEYFPMEKTIAELLDIYHQFFSIEFEEVHATGFWHEDVKVIRVLQDNKLLGTLILDLYPRSNKFSHACHSTIVPSTYSLDGNRIPDVSIVIANFSKPTETKPSLLKSSEVTTFFHEFGHALHAILGATEIASLSGTHTKTDFVELPSQMLEEWLNDKDILKKVSGHYITGEQLPDELIDTIIQLKNFNSGQFVTRQTWLAAISLAYFGPETNKDPYALMKELYKKYIPYGEFIEDTHFYTSFGHLTGYAAKYYGYLWSLVFALDIFKTIKQHGLLNPAIGKKYVQEVIGKGGAQDPNELLYNFLGREPNTDAFFEEMGL